MSPQDRPFDVTSKKWNISVHIHSCPGRSSISGRIYPDHIRCSEHDIDANVESFYNTNFDKGLVLWYENPIKGYGQPTSIRHKIGSHIIASSIISFGKVEVK